MDIISLYNDVLDRTATEQNGSITIEKFNRFNRIAELRMLDYLSGDVEGVKPPEPYTTSKLRDWLSIFVKPFTAQVQDGYFTRPEDFYRVESNSIIGDYRDEVCGKDVLVSNGNTPIDILPSEQFEYRCQTYIKRLKPSAKKPIGRIVGTTIETMPVDLGSVKLYYVRYPVFGEIKVMVDQLYNNEVPNQATSINSEWPEFARNFILYFIVQQYPVSTRERALVEQNELVNKSPRG
jgi:hypothetical protein